MGGDRRRRRYRPGHDGDRSQGRGLHAVDAPRAPGRLHAVLFLIRTPAGLSGAAGFGVSAAFVGYDRDGWLDLYVGHNVDYGLDNDAECPNQAGVGDYCPPQVYGGIPDHLCRNRGHGRFTDVSDTALVGGRFGPALGVVTADFDGDGWIDIYVANDGTEPVPDRIPALRVTCVLEPQGPAGAYAPAARRDCLLP